MTEDENHADHHSFRGFALKSSHLLSKRTLQSLAVLVSLVVATSCTHQNRPLVIEQTQDRGCQVQGDENVVNCKVLLPGSPPIEGFKFSTTIDGHWIYYGSPDDLPAAPDYPNGEYAQHCDRWTNWFSTMPRMLHASPSVSLEITAGTTELIVVRRIHLVVYEEAAFDAGKDHTHVVCDHFKHKFIPGYYLNTSVESRVAKIREGTRGDFEQMPPASISIRDEGVTISITPQGKEGRIYSGKIVVEYDINGQTRQVHYGDENNSYRWTTGRTSQSAPHRDWDERDHRWKTPGEVVADR